MKKNFILFIFCAFTLVSNAGITVTGSIVSGGITRTYRLYIPSIYNANNPPCPLIINMHGYTSNASDQQLYTNFMPIADTANFLMVYPQGTLDNTNTTFWNAGVNNGLVDDIGFLSSLIDTLKAHYNINLNRVYSTGFSMGGFMSHILACALNNKIAAIASVSGTFFTYQFPYNPGRAVPVMQIHGTADPTVPYSGLINMIGVDSTVAFWVHNNGCNTTPVFTAVPNTNTSDLSTAEHYVYNNGNNGTTVEFFKIIGGAHSWPGAFNIGVVTNEDVNASKEIWRFFSQYSLSTTTAVAENRSHNNLMLYPNPANGNFTLELALQQDEKSKLQIVNSIGQIIITENHNFISGTNRLQFNLTDKPKGVYFVEVQTSLGILRQKVVVD